MCNAKTVLKALTTPMDDHRVRCLSIVLSRDTTKHNYRYTGV